MPQSLFRGRRVNMQINQINLHSTCNDAPGIILLLVHDNMHHPQMRNSYIGLLVLLTTVGFNCNL